MMRLLLLSVALAWAEKPPIPAGLDGYLPVPDANPLTTEKVALGRKLFFDTRLSRDGTVSCATCHDPQTAFTDKRALGAGIGAGAGALIGSQVRLRRTVYPVRASGRRGLTIAPLFPPAGAGAALVARW